MSTPVFTRFTQGTNSVRPIPFKAHKINEFSPEALESYYEEVYGSTIRLLNELELQNACSDLSVIDVTNVEVHHELVMRIGNQVLLHEVYLDCIGESGGGKLESTALESAISVAFSLDWQHIGDRFDQAIAASRDAFDVDANQNGTRITVNQPEMHIDSETKIKRKQHLPEPQSRQNMPSWLALIRGPLYPVNAVLSFLINIPVMNAVWRERRDLELLTVEHMRDIGLDPAHVQQECRRSFFDIPSNRKRSVMVLGEASYERAF